MSHFDNTPRVRRPTSRLLMFLVATALATMVIQIVPEREARADFFSVWGQVHGGYLGGVGGDRFEEGGQGFFGGSLGISITVIDVFVDLRMDSFDTDTAGMWNQIGAGASFGIPLGIVEILLGLRAAYVYAQFNTANREAYQNKLNNGSRLEEPPEKGLNISAQAGVDVEIAGPLLGTVVVDLGYAVFLPEPTNSHGFNFAVLGGLKLKFGF